MFIGIPQLKMAQNILCFTEDNLLIQILWNIDAVYDAHSDWQGFFFIQYNFECSNIFLSDVKFIIIKIKVIILILSNSDAVLDQNTLAEIAVTDVQTDFAILYCSG